LLIKLLSLYVHPSHPRDHCTIACVARDLRSLLLLPAGSLVAGAYGATVWNSRMGRVMVEVAGAAIVVGFIHMVSAVRRLRQEMAYRVVCRSKRLALPVVLAAGITAAEKQDAPKTAEVISIRISKMKDFSDQSIQVFDVLMFDLLESHPGLSKELRRMARAAQTKAKALTPDGTQSSS